MGAACGCEQQWGGEDWKMSGRNTYLVGERKL